MWELIDTLWNVNTLAPRPQICLIEELIDTLWNVNVTGCSCWNRLRDELIDTLWNVNKYSYDDFYAVSNAN